MSEGGLVEEDKTSTRTLKRNCYPPWVERLKLKKGGPPSLNRTI